MSEPRLLAGDIGGTHTRLRLSRFTGQGLELLCERRYASAEHADFSELLRAFLTDCGETADAACLGVAGPVRESGEDTTAEVTNLPWRLSARALSEATGIPRLCLTNDFSLIGHALPALGEDDLVTLQAGDPQPEAMAAVLGAGTGLGQVLVLPGPEPRRVWATEGGHVDFAARTEEDWHMLLTLKRRFGHVSAERLLSGAGLRFVYEFLEERRGRPTPPAIREAREAGRDIAPEVTRLGLSGEDPLAAQALDRFVELYGAQAGNLALACLPRAGLFIAGGIARHLLPLLERGPFLTAFLDKGRMRPLLETIPLAVITHPDPGLLGATRLTRQLL